MGSLELRYFPKVFRELLQLSDEEIKKYVTCLEVPERRGCVLEEVVKCSGVFPENIHYEFDGYFHEISIRELIDGKLYDLTIECDSDENELIYTLEIVEYSRTDVITANSGEELIEKVREELIRLLS